MSLATGRKNGENMVGHSSVDR